MKWNFKLWNFNNWEPPKPVQIIKPVKVGRKLGTISPQLCYHQPWLPNLNPNASPFKCPHAFITRLRKKGYTKLGSGAYSTVMWKKGNRVIKVIRSLDNWIDYCKWAAEAGYAGNLAPRVYSWKRVGDFAIASMEKIEYVATSLRGKEDEFCYTSLLSNYLTFDNAKSIELLDKFLPGSKSFAYDLKSRFSYLDVHNGNIMFRADGSMVVVDPVCGQLNTKVLRLRARDFGLAAH